MDRKDKSAFSGWLFAAAILTVLSLGAMPGRSAAACTVDPAATGSASELPDKEPGPCLGGVAPGWRPAVLQWREHRRQSEARRFAGRIKRHLGLSFAGRREQFRAHRGQIERQRRAFRRRKARAKARQFAAARRHAAKHAPRYRHGLIARQKYGSGKLGHLGRPATPNSSNARHALHWRSLWRHGAHNDAQPPSD